VPEYLFQWVHFLNKLETKVSLGIGIPVAARGFGGGERTIRKATIEWRFSMGFQSGDLQEDSNAEEQSAERND